MSAGDEIVWQKTDTPWGFIGYGSAPPTLFDRFIADPDADLHALAAVSRPSPQPLARNSDPASSREAAERVKPGNGELIRAIRTAVRVHREPLSAFDIAAALRGNERWSEATIRTAVSRAGLRAVDTDGRSPRGSRCIRYSL